MRRVWPMIVASGAASVAFRLLYGELFGPTKLLPALWPAPVDDATRLLTFAIAAGAVLLGISYLVGIVNRRRLRRISSRTAQERQRSTQPLP
jgi:V/A-type H+-transporting ATPase subunit I